MANHDPEKRHSARGEDGKFTKAARERAKPKETNKPAEDTDKAAADDEPVNKRKPAYDPLDWWFGD